MLSLYDRAAVIPGRSMTRSKAPDRLRKAWAAYGDGPCLYDTDGNVYLDMVCALGAISLGYGRLDGRRVATNGVYSLPHRMEIEAAEAVLQHVAPWASSVRFVKSGSESTSAARRIAMKATQWRVVLMGDKSYHGHHEWCDDPAFPSTRRYVMGQELEVGDHWDEWNIAAVFVEPPRFEPLNITWLRYLREWCDRKGALLVFDEMIWGGRHALGGCSQYSGVIPDLACYGKAFGNGEAVAFVVGRDALAEHGEIVSGTFSGDVTGLASVCDVLNTYTSEPVIETLWARGRQLREGLERVIPPTIAVLDGMPPLQRIRFHQPEHKEQFKDAMHWRGILTYPDWFMTMYAHTPQQIDMVIEAAAASVKELR